MTRSDRRSPWITLCARLTLAAFASTLPGPAAWAQVVERVAPLTAPALSAPAAVSFSAASLAGPSALSIAAPLSGAALAPAPLSAPALAATPLAAPAASAPAAPVSTHFAAASPTNAAEAPTALGSLRAAVGAAADGRKRSGGETFDASKPRDGGAAVPADPSNKNPSSKGPRLAPDAEIAGLPAAYNTFQRLNKRMKAIGMPVEIRRIAISDFEAIAKGDADPAISLALRAHLQKMMEEPWSTKGGAFPDKPKVTPVEYVIFPGERASISVPAGSEAAKNILAAKGGADGGYVLTVTQSDEGDRPYRIATLARVISATTVGNEVKAELQGIREAVINNVPEAAVGERAAVTYREIPLGDGEKITALARELSEIGKRQGQSPKDILELVAQGPRAMTDYVVADLVHNLQIPLDEQQDLLAAQTVEQRLDDAMWYLRTLWPEKGEGGSPERGAKVSEAAAKEIEAEFAKKIEEAGMPEKVKAVALRELKKLKSSETASEREGYQSYLEWLTDIPWSKRSENREIDLAAAEELMGQTHTGLQMVKDRILEFLAVRQLTKSDKGAILAFVGPPGVGKSTIAKAIAKAMGRKFVRKSVGGKTDISELVGHGRTYTKSRPGAIIRKMVEAGENDPVFLLDEVDKMGSGERGDPMSTLLDILDPEQQDTFEDTYMEVPYDLSHVVWIITINDLSKVTGPLKDRMEIIDFTSYTASEKVRIAQNHILPDKRAKNGFKPGEPALDDETVRFMIDGYTQETGVRNVEKVSDALLRKVAYKSLREKKPLPATLTKAEVEAYLGKPKFLGRKAWANEPGDAWGLGVNSVGGSILSIQVRMKEGTGQLRLRKEMKESADDSANNSYQVVYDYIKANSRELGVDVGVLTKNDFTLAFAPAGPVDGPSAGITMATALTSLVTGRKVREDVAMTGEIDLGGRVHAIGGLKEKVMAAHRQGKRTVLYPLENEADIEDIPKEVRAEMTLHAVSTFKQVLGFALEPKPEAPASVVAPVKGEPVK
ncbi:MAG: S16 family serine protease [Elusimicrobiota bacterium]